jgi:hypothetical protein
MSFILNARDCTIIVKKNLVPEMTITAGCVRNDIDEACGGAAMYILRFEAEADGLYIYQLGHDNPIGRIIFCYGDWYGEMTLDGYYATAVGKTQQTVVDEFEAWIAAGMPPESPLLKLDSSKLPI